MLGFIFVIYLRTLVEIINRSSSLENYKSCCQFSKCSPSNISLTENKHVLHYTKVFTRTFKTYFGKYMVSKVCCDLCSGTFLAPCQLPNAIFLFLPTTNQECQTVTISICIRHSEVYLQQRDTIPFHSGD